MDGQIDLFKAGKEKLRFDKPVRLIELFSGYGKKVLALKKRSKYGAASVWSSR